MFLRKKDISRVIGVKGIVFIIVGLCFIISPLIVEANKQVQSSSMNNKMNKEAAVSSDEPESIVKLDIIKDIPEMSLDKASLERMIGNKKIKREIFEERGAKSKTFELEDGSISTLYTFQDIHFVNSSGEWDEINPTIVSQSRQAQRNILKQSSDASGMYVIDGLPYTVSLPRNISYGYEIGVGSKQLRFTPTGVFDSYGQIDFSDNKSIRYEDAWTDTDVELEMKTWGIKETITMKSENSPTNYTFEIAGYINEEFKGEQVRLLPSWLVDALGNERMVEQNIVTENGKTFLQLIIDTSGLHFPIKVDPTVIWNSTEQFMSGSDPMEWEIEFDNSKTITSIDLYVRANVRHIRDFEYWTGTIYGFEELIGYGEEKVYSLPTNAFSNNDTILYLDATTGGAEVYLEVRHEDVGSDTPSVIYPNGGEVLNNVAQMTFEISSYISNEDWNLEISLDEGQSWRNIKNRINWSTFSRNDNVVNVSVNLVGLKNTEKALVRIKEYTFLNGSDWAVSNQVFSIINTSGSFQYVYDNNGRLKFIKILPDGEIIAIYTYDANGNLLNVERL
jgi:hypothetical protein